MTERKGKVMFRKVIVDLPDTVELCGERQFKIRELVDGSSKMLPDRFETGEGEAIAHISLEEFQSLTRQK